MASVTIDTKNNHAVVTFTAAEASLAKLLVTFFDPEAVINPRINTSFIRNLANKTVRQVKLDLNHSSVKKETVLAMLKGVDKIK